MNRAFHLLAAALIALGASCRGRDDAAPPAGTPSSGTGTAAIAAIGSDAGVAAAGDAGASGAATPSSHEYRAALRKGRELARRHDWPGAIAAFEQATRIAPGDARAMSELGWAAFRAGDLDRAELASRAAAAIEGASARVKAAALYNLGRTREARGDRDGAAAAFRDSLALRRSRTVRRHLRELERGHAAPGPATGAGTGAAVVIGEDDEGDDAMAGPYPSIEAYCDAELAREDGGAICLPTSGLAAGPDRMGAPPAPLDAVRVIAVRGELDDVTCVLALHGADGWYLWNGVPCQTTTAAGTDWAASLSLETPAPARVVARFALGLARRSDDGRGRHACQEIAVACTIDPPRPACTPPVAIGWAASCADAPTGAAPAIRWDAQADWSLDGDHLVVRPPPHARAAPDGLSELAAARVPLR